MVITTKQVGRRVKQAASELQTATRKATRRAKGTIEAQIDKLQAALGGARTRKKASRKQATRRAKKTTAAKRVVRKTSRAKSKPARAR